MKLPKSLIFGMIIIGIALLLYLRNVDNRLWEHVDRLTPICQDDELIKKVTSFKQYNGITEINGKYKLLVSYLESKGEVLVVYEPEKIDSIVKYEGKDSLLLYTKDKDDPLKLKAVFDCNN